MKNDTEPKENNLEIHYVCKEGGCGFRKMTKYDFCKYLTYSTMSCNSKVAQVNALTIRLQELTGKKVGLR